jgi:hypothetical protein
MNHSWTEEDRHWRLDINSEGVDIQNIFDKLKEKSEENILIKLLNLNDEERRNIASSLKTLEHNQDRILIVAGPLDDESRVEWAPTLSEARDLMFMAILEKELSKE